MYNKSWNENLILDSNSSVSVLTYVKLKSIMFYFSILLHCIQAGNSIVGIATGYGLEDWGVGVWVPVGQEFSLLHVLQTGYGAHPASYPMGTGGSFPRGKAVGAWNWPLTSSWGQENVDLCIHSPIHLHGIVLNYLSTGTNLHFFVALYRSDFGGFMPHTSQYL
jgi:hypothetical protein